MKRKRPLTSLQYKLLQEIKKFGKIRWVSTKAKETLSLNSLVKRGILKVHNLKPNGDYSRNTYWTIK